ncbi:hypothetical protein, partial [Pseudomonas fragi]|uniref:hypothetical protein n=1 Tax=Pseudomonas fragi TaxID=296 RepID=UPI0020040949
EHQTGCFALELRGKGTALLGHQTPLWGEHSRLNECPVSLDHYSLHKNGTDAGVFEKLYGYYGSCATQKWRPLGQASIDW